MTENELQIIVENVKSGDREAFNKLFRHFYSPLVRFCFRFVVDEDVAAEVVQDFFVKLWSNRENLNINSSFKSYMMQSVRNMSLTYINRERSHVEANKALTFRRISPTATSSKVSKTVLFISNISCWF